MGSTVERTRLIGKVIGHTVKYYPQSVEERGSGVTVTKADKLRAFVTIQVDDKRMYTVPSKKSEMVLAGQDPTEENRELVYNTLTGNHPFNSERAFNECAATPKKKGAHKWYELEE